MNETQLANFAGIDWATVWQQVQSAGLDFGFKAIIAILIFYVGRIIAGLVSRAMHKLMQAQEVDKILETFVCNLAYWALMTFVIIAAISQIGIQTTSLIAVMGAAGLAVGLALQGSLANFAAGVLIVLFRPYRVGDWVEAAGISGAVVQVQILTTMLKTGDNKSIIVPNGQVMSSIITNYSANATRRVDLTIGVAYNDDLDKVRSTIQSLIDADDRILDDPECLIAVAELADSSVN
ncbi:MAG: small conductance mechanosensitive channel, partial [Woeseiaceae bacterium]